MIKTLLCDEANQFRVVEDPDAISEIVLNKNRHLWIDIERPQPGDMLLLQEEFGFHPLAIEDAIMRHQRPKVDQYSNFYLVIFYSVALDKPDGEDGVQGRRGLRGTNFLYKDIGDSYGSPEVNEDKPRAPLQAYNGDGPALNGLVMREITMFMGANYLITVHEDYIPELDEAARRWQRNIEVIGGHGQDNHVAGTRLLTEIERRKLRVQRPDEATDTLVVPPPQVHGGSNSTPSGVVGGAAKGGPVSREEAEHTNDIGILLYSLMDSIVDNYFPVIDSIVDRVEDLEIEVFQNFNQGAIHSIFSLKKDLLALRRVLAPERDVLNVLIRRDLPIFEPHTLTYFQDVYDHVVRITDSIDTYRDLLSSAMDSYLSMQSNRLNITVQNLTSVSIILMSVSAISGWFGMNFVMMPELSSPLGYPLTILAVLTVVGIEFLFFKRRGWL